jgi:uncharacterized membrane protein
MNRLLALGALLRLCWLGARSLWFDEASTLILARLPLRLLPGVVLRNEMNTPLYAAAMHAWLFLFADPRIGLRLFSALCGIGALLAFRALAERVLPPRARLLAVFFACCSSYWLHAAQDGRVYALLVLIAVLTACVVHDLSARPTPALWARYAVLCAAGLYAHYFFAFTLVVHAAWLFFRPRRSLRDWALAHAGTALLFLPWAVRIPAQLRLHAHDLAVGDPLTVRRASDLLGNMFFDPTFLGLALPSWLTPAIGAAFAALLAVSVYQRRLRSFTLVHFAAPLFLIALAELFVGRPITQARYFYAVSPFAFLLGGAALEGTGWPRRAVRLTFAAVAAAGVAAYIASGLYVDPHLERLADLLRGTDARSPIVYTETYYYLPMRYYYMPERPHFLVAAADEGMDYKGMPPYDGVVSQARLSALGPVVVMDEKRLLGGPVRFLSDGAQAAELVAAHPGAFARPAAAAAVSRRRSAASRRP